jgi:hypothetical protein
MLAHSDVTASFLHLLHSYGHVLHSHIAKQDCYITKPSVQTTETTCKKHRAFKLEQPQHTIPQWTFPLQMYIEISA